ncbi:MAG: hypothetical protein QM765_04275 [Myxococcales bacterium]
MTLRRLLPVLLAAAFAVTFACFDVPKPELEGRACNASHPCLDGFDCVGGKCVAFDASTCTPGVPLCREGNWYDCSGGAPLLKAACADAGLDCEGARGCLAPCGSGCATGTACDLSVQRCVRQPRCANVGDCEGGNTCLSGACVAPSTQALVFVEDAGRSAQLACYTSAPADAGTSWPDAAVPLVTMNGWVVTPAGTMSPQTAGLDLKVFLASAFDEQENPTAVAKGKSVGSGDAGVGAFTLRDVPVGPGLVVQTSGANAVTTYQYLAIRAEDVTGGVAYLAVTSFGRELWQQLADSSGVAIREGRGGLAGQIFDCGAQPAKVKGATAALDTEVRTFYSLATLVGLDPEARATSESGRFFMFDVPALPVSLVAQLGEAVVTRKVRVKPDSVTVYLVRP